MVRTNGIDRRLIKLHQLRRSKGKTDDDSLTTIQSLKSFLHDCKAQSEKEDIH